MMTTKHTDNVQEKAREAINDHNVLSGERQVVEGIPSDASSWNFSMRDFQVAPRRRSRMTKIAIQLLLVTAAVATALMGAFHLTRVTSNNTDVEFPLHRRSLRVADDSSTPTRILYIITTLAEYNTGTRNTVRGSDR